MISDTLSKLGFMSTVRSDNLSLSCDMNIHAEMDNHCKINSGLNKAILKAVISLLCQDK